MQCFMPRGARLSRTNYHHVGTVAKAQKRANYQALIWRKYLEGNPFIPEPEQHGWIAYDDELSIAPVVAPSIANVCPMD